MLWIRGGALLTGLAAVVAGAIVLFVVQAFDPIPGSCFSWAMGVTLVTAFFAGYFGYLAGIRARGR